MVERERERTRETGRVLEVAAQTQISPPFLSSRTREKKQAANNLGLSFQITLFFGPSHKIEIDTHLAVNS